MKRIVALLAIVAAITLGAAAPAHADTDSDANNFSFSSFDAHYTLDRDADGYSLLRTVETVVAKFPREDQNHGIVRALVGEYEGIPTNIDVESVTDETGRDIAYENDGDTLQIGDEDLYEHGEQTYVITYTQSNVTRYFADTDDDEFYWDVNGFDWEQRFDRVSATVTIASELLDARTGRAAAPYGFYGSTEQATLTETPNGYTASVDDLGSGQNLSIIVGFEPGTFAVRPTGFFDAVWPTLSLLSLLITAAGLVLAIRLRLTRLADAPGRGTIIAQYEAPKGVSVPMSAVLLGKKGKLTPAMIISLAVSGHVRVVEVAEGRKPSYRLDFLTVEGAGRDELDFLHALFGETFETGESHSLKKNDEKAAKKISELTTRVTEDATSAGYRKALPENAVFGTGAVAVIGFILTAVFAFLSLAEAYGGGIPLLFLAVALLLTIIAIVVLVVSPLTEKGVEVRDHLAGLKVYIDLAEEDRLRYLQSPEGAERQKFDATDGAAIVRLNEKLLPYAILFGNERRWAEELGKYYEKNGVTPDWYYGSASFNAVYFATTIGTINASASTSLTSASSTSGGSIGGFSGGGGGGGGGGGW